MKVDGVPVTGFNRVHWISRDGLSDRYAVVKHTSNQDVVLGLAIDALDGGRQETHGVGGVVDLGNVVVDLDAIRVGEPEFTVNGTEVLTAEVTVARVVHDINVEEHKRVDAAATVSVRHVVGSQHTLGVRVAVAVGVEIKDNTVAIRDLSGVAERELVDVVENDVVGNDGPVRLRRDGQVFRSNDGDTGVPVGRTVSAVPDTVPEDENLVGATNSDTVPTNVVNVVVDNADVLAPDVAKGTDSTSILGGVVRVDERRVVDTTDLKASELDVLSVPELDSVHRRHVDDGAVSGKGSDEDVIPGRTLALDLQILVHVDSRAVLVTVLDVQGITRSKTVDSVWKGGKGRSLGEPVVPVGSGGTVDVVHGTRSRLDELVVGHVGIVFGKETVNRGRRRGG